MPNTLVLSMKHYRYVLPHCWLPPSWCLRHLPEGTEGSLPPVHRLHPGTLHLRPSAYLRPHLPSALWEGYLSVSGKSARSRHFVKLSDHLLIKVPVSISMGNIPEASPTPNTFSIGQFPVDITCQRGHKRNIFHMLLFVQKCLIQMGNAPSLRNVILEQLCQLFGGLLCDGVSPVRNGTGSSPSLSNAI